MLKYQLKDRIYDYINEKNISKILGMSNNIRVQFLAQGEYNINYVIYDENKKYVFRVNTGSQIQSENQIKYEFNAIKRLEVSLVTPKAYYVDDSKEYLPYGVLIMEFLEGNPLDYKTDLKKAADIFSKIHSIKLQKEDFNNFIVEKNIFSDRVNEGELLLKEYLVSPLVDKERKKFFCNFLEWAENNKYKEKYFINNKWQVINNTEVNSGNFIIGMEKSYLIDWEKPVISDPCQDITQFLAPTTTLWKANYILKDEEKDNFFNIYSQNLGCLKEDIEERVKLYNPYLYLRALSWCANAWLKYKNPDKDIKNIDTLTKIEEYLDLDFMKGLIEN